MSMLLNTGQKSVSAEYIVTMRMAFRFYNFKTPHYSILNIKCEFFEFFFILD